MKQKEYLPNTGDGFMADELLPCPFCGSEVELIFIGNDYTKSRKVTVKCSEIHCRVQRTDAALKHNHEWVARVAIEGWNKRVDTKQCMYCEKTVEYSSGVFVCEECSGDDDVPQHCTVCGKKCETNNYIGFPLCDECNKSKSK